jgi:predicted Co/Zn/Cd cation transporter (cation efflux family)
MSADAVWNITYLGVAVVWVATCWWWLRRERRRTNTPFWEADRHRHLQQREVDESHKIGWRRG